MSMWSELPPELLRTISQKQINYVDYLSIRAVCKSWRTAIPKKPHNLLCSLPWLLLPYHKNKPNNRGFYNLSNDKTYFIELPENHEKRCCGSSHGWLIMVDDTPAIFLLNPLTKARIELPSLSTFPNFPTEVVYQNSRNINEYFIRNSKIQIRETYIRKAILSEDPSTGASFMVMAIFTTFFSSGQNLAFCKSGDKAWSTIQETTPVTLYRDLMFFAGKFYVVDDNGKISICNTDCSSITHVAADPPPLPPRLGYKQWYLGFLNENLILIGRFRKYRIPGSEYQTHNFLVYKLDIDRSIWSEVNSLGDKIIFLGWNSFHSISASDCYNNNNNCKANCIYFTDDYFKILSSNAWEGHDFGVFQFDDRSVLRLGVPSYPIKLPHLRSIHRDMSMFILPPPVWVTISVLDEFV